MNVLRPNISFVYFWKRR